MSFARPDRVGGLNLPLKVTFERAESRREGDEEQVMEDFRVTEVEDAGGEPLNRAAVRCRLQTMLIENQTEAGYWLDTGVLQVKLG